MGLITHASMCILGLVATYMRQIQNMTRYVPQNIRLDITADRSLPRTVKAPAHEYDCINGKTNLQQTSSKFQTDGMSHEQRKKQKYNQILFKKLRVFTVFVHCFLTMLEFVTSSTPPSKKCGEHRQVGWSMAPHTCMNFL